MSIINKMLQELDRRQGAGNADGTLVQQVRSVPPARADREWFWRIMAVLLVVALGWVVWLVWQLQPRESVATALALKAAQNAPRVAAAPAPVPAAEARPAAPEPVAEKPAAEAKPVAPSQPVVEAKPAPVKAAPKAPEAPKPAPKAPTKAAPQMAATATPEAPPAAKAAPSAPPAKMLGLDVPPARILQAPSQGPSRVEKRDRTRSPEDRAESEFRRGAVLLNEGRVAEAEDIFAVALGISPAHEAARQALVALHLEQGRIDDARRLLQEGVALNPSNARFASVLARVHIERRDFAAALAVINGVKGPEQGGVELQTMRGTVLQQLGRHAEAVEAFQNALRGSPQNGAVWMGLAISLESSGKNSEAADAFRRAAATGTLGVETKAYAEQRARQLR